ncbi:MAG: hypothetical protein NZ529_07565 [Cytophagaceae bacterium]|nr:hypothetical protein [Cytophagaceae bacterium]MDW8456642.1 hypothetical protein [Cytophagaceae bacterium]
MKKLAIASISVGIMLSGIASYAGFDGAKEKAKTRFVSYEKQINRIKSLIGSPDVELDGPCKVVVNFTISKENVIYVNEINTDNPAIERYIFREIHGKKIKGNFVELKNQVLEFEFIPEKDNEYFIF